MVPLLFLALFVSVLTNPNPDPDDIHIHLHGLGNEKVIDFAVADELFWETNTQGYSYVNSLCGQGLDNVPLSHGQTWTIG